MSQTKEPAIQQVLFINSAGGGIEPSSPNLGARILAVVRHPQGVVARCSGFKEENA